MDSSHNVECLLLLLLIATVTFPKLKGETESVCRHRNDNSCSVLGLSCTLRHHVTNPHPFRVSDDGLGKPRDLDTTLYLSGNLTYLNITWLPPQGSVHKGWSGLKNFRITVHYQPRNRLKETYVMDLTGANWTTFTTKDEDEMRFHLDHCVEIRGMYTYSIEVTSLPYVHENDDMSQTTSLSMQASDSALVMPVIVRKYMYNTGRDMKIMVTFGSHPAVNHSTSTSFNKFNLTVTAYYTSSKLIEVDEKEITGRQFTFSKVRPIGCGLQYEIKVIPIDTFGTPCESDRTSCTTLMYEHYGPPHSDLPCVPPAPASTSSYEETPEEVRTWDTRNKTTGSVTYTLIETTVTPSMDAPIIHNVTKSSTIAAIVIGCIVGLLAATVFLVILYRVWQIRGPPMVNTQQQSEIPAVLNNNLTMVCDHSAGGDGLQGAEGGCRSAVIIFTEDSKAHSAIVESLAQILHTMYGIQYSLQTNFSLSQNTDLCSPQDFVFVILSQALVHHQTLSLIENWWNCLHQTFSQKSNAYSSCCNNSLATKPCNGLLTLPRVICLSYSPRLLSHALPIPVDYSLTVLNDLKSLDVVLKHCGVIGHTEELHPASAYGQIQSLYHLIAEANDPNLDCQSDSSSCSEKIREINRKFDDVEGISVHSNNLVLGLDDEQDEPRMNSTSSV